MNQKLKFLILSLILVAGYSHAQPFGSGGVQYMKPIRYLNKEAGSIFYEIKCNTGSRIEVLYEPQNSKRWFMVPPADHLSFYVGGSAEAFAQAACGRPNVKKSSAVAKISGGVGATASGLKTYDISCSNGKKYILQNSPSGEWWDLENGASYDRYKGNLVKDIAEKICQVSNQSKVK